MSETAGVTIGFGESCRYDRRSGWKRQRVDVGGRGRVSKTAGVTIGLGESCR